MYKAVILFLCCFSLTACNTEERSPDETTMIETKVQTEQPAKVSREQAYAIVTNTFVTDTGRFIEADYIQFLSGEAAIEAAKKEGEADMFVENGDTSYAVPNDHYILNTSKKIRRLLLTDNVAFELVTNPERDPPVINNDFETFVKIFKDNLFILTLENGRIVKVEEVFIP